MQRKPRPYIGMHFKCCNTYARLYLNRLGNAYFGGCPRCGRTVRIPAVRGGSKSKFWEA